MAIMGRISLRFTYTMAVIVGHCSWIQFLVVLRTSRGSQRTRGWSRQSSRWRTDRWVSVVMTSMPIRKSALELVHAGAHELHDLVVHIAICKCSADDRQRHILGTYTLDGFSVQINADGRRAS